MRKLKVAIYVAGITAAAACAVPWYLGMRTEQTMREEMRAFAAEKHAAANVTFLQYERGWFSSVAVTRVALTPHSSSSLDIRHDITHVPDPRTGWVRIHSIPVWTGRTKQQFNYLFSGQPAVAVDTVVMFSGDRVASFTSPAFSKPLQEADGSVLTWGGMRGVLKIDRNAHVDVSITVPEVGLETSGTTIIAKQLAVEAAWDMRGSAVEWQGETKAALGELAFSGAGQEARVAAASGVIYQRTRGEHLSMGYTLRLGSGTATRPGLQPESFESAVLDMEFDRIDKKALTRYLTDLSNAERLRLAPQEQQRLAQQLAQDFFADVLRGSPVLRLKQFGVHMPNGAVSAHATMSFDGSALSQARLSPDLWTRLNAKGVLTVSATLLRAQLHNRARSQASAALLAQGTPNTEENIGAWAEQMTETQLKALMQLGLLRTNGADFIIEAQLAAGQILINGQPLNGLLNNMLMPTPPATDREELPETEAAKPVSMGHIARR
jgi:uncharacterized protein YdgA (DUF945 family)